MGALLLLPLFLLPFGGEIFLQDERALFLQYAADHLGAVVEPHGVEVKEAAEGTGFGVGGAIIDAVQPGVDDRSGAHGAGLQRDIELRAGEPPALELFGGLQDGQQLGMRTGVLLGLAPVVCAGNDLALIDDDGAHRAAVGGL